MRFRVATLLLSFLSIEASAQPGWGKFEGALQTEWLSNGRDMKLLAAFAYVDQASMRWAAPTGSIVNGASIPQPFWSFIGGPFEGKYRNASVVHDVACDRRDKPWKDVHRMFYNASRLGGVGLVSGKVMYFAVYHWGPRWKRQRRQDELDSVTLVALLQEVQPPTRAVSSDADFLRGREFIRRHPDISLSRIEELTSAELLRTVPRVPPPLRIDLDRDVEPIPARASSGKDSLPPMFDSLAGDLAIFGVALDTDDRLVSSTAVTTLEAAQRPLGTRSDASRESAARHRRHGRYLM
ncbi:MAG TPA: DUF1353 domain-containing protein [Gemmatimonadaceae bacterium]|nr:DUF1353 domain-containing protein [Gemmatimonadaceae bacterium]